jgi:hypothetical protein
MQVIMKMQTYLEEKTKNMNPKKIKKIMSEQEKWITTP